MEHIKIKDQKKKKKKIPKYIPGTGCIFYTADDGPFHMSTEKPTDATES